VAWIHWVQNSVQRRNRPTVNMIIKLGLHLGRAAFITRAPISSTESLLDLDISNSKLTSDI
jgi:hypothetical protein